MDANRFRTPCRSPGGVLRIRPLMETRSMRSHSLARATGIPPSRLETLLNKNPDDVTAITVSELENIITALNLDALEAILRADTFNLIPDDRRDRYEPIIHVLSAIFREVSATVLQAAVELDTIGDPEVKSEWTPVLKDVILQRIVKEIAVAAGHRTRWMLDV
ncbi:helix-turn-helix domain-containing protein [Hephaestia caeni]|nr:helix-turn-helix transcriptional regulator [Hephaestia caeni]